ncbi:hypothetical protein [Catenulispora pinisilvae]|uniref:hypothetical protein n=1 Tax=Catenulispora pinisilvae TaxID=2705253 RepID=UPI0018925EEF|nr:hypothetical protein [Catenulispora pinisilvae]
MPVDAIARRFPLVSRVKPPGRPLTARVAALGRTQLESARDDHYQQVALASEVFNIAALIASDCGMSQEARDLCWRQHAVFNAARPLSPQLAKLALQPVLNIPRQMIRDGDGAGAYGVLLELLRAAQERRQADVVGYRIDMADVTRDQADHRAVCTQLWAALGADGSRALAQAGRWSEAAAALSAHKLVGNRLLDGRQIAVISLLERGLAEQAAAMVDASATTESWEKTAAAVLRAYCATWTSEGDRHLEVAVGEALTLVEIDEPTTVVFRVRVGLTALDIAQGRSPLAPRLQAAVIAAACTDAYAAREVLAHESSRKAMTAQDSSVLTSIADAAGFGRGLMPDQMRQVMARVASAETDLRALLAKRE